MFPRRTPAIPAPLRQSPLADVLSRAELRQLGQMGTAVDIERGRKIITESTYGRECFVIVDGEFAVNGTNVTAVVGAGEVAGELALLTGRRRTASVVARSDASVYALTAREFATLMSNSSGFRSHVTATATERTGQHDFTLPAQYVRRNDEHTSAAMSWSGRLADVPRWKPPH